MPERVHNSAESPQKVDGYIDAHVHLWRPDLRRYPLAAGFSPESMRPASFTPEDLLPLANPFHVNRFVLIQMVFYEFDNSYMLDCIEKYPGVFSGVALVDEHAADPAAEMRRLRSLGVRGVRIVPPSPGAAGWLEGAGMRAIWSAGADERMAICPLIDVADLPAVDRMCRAYPKTPVVIDHCARIGGAEPIRDSEVAQLCRFAEHPEVYVKLSAFYFLGAKRPPYTDLLPMLKKLLAAFGSERLMWATDCPFQVQKPHTYQASLDLIRCHWDSIADRDRHWMLSGTAEAVFFT